MATRDAVSCLAAQPRAAACVYREYIKHKRAQDALALTGLPGAAVVRMGATSDLH